MTAATFNKRLLEVNQFLFLLSFKDLGDDTRSQSYFYVKSNDDYSTGQTEDLTERIRGLYRLLDLQKDNGSNGLGMFLLPN